MRSSSSTVARPGGSRWLLCSLAVAGLGSALAAGACSGESSGGGGAGATGAGEGLCQAIADAINGCEGATPCDLALVQDCQSVVELLSAPYAEALIRCIEGGESPQACLASSLGALTPTPAQQDFAAQFCAECTPALSGCVETFWTGTGDHTVAGRIVLPLRNAWADTMAAECAVGETCRGTFLSCAEDVIARQGIPERTAACLLDTLAGNLPSDQRSPCGTGTGGFGGGEGAGGAGPGGSGGDEPACSRNPDEPDNDSESSAPYLGTLGDCDGDESHQWIALPPNDVDWYVFSGEDGLCVVDPTVDWQPYDGQAEVCMYFECEDLELTCPEGTTAADSPGGRPGCCGEGTFAAEIDCAGISDDATVYLRVASGSLQCQEGFLYFHY
ncbi:MAG: hypothetical protein JRI23_05240 [Deltaproteobacteria bacterium]|jgi:hypothetical protein|nr:hypothetical protein [Deltaproteobacteria bacterium]MBW2530956.1 hypothetical protein [Deltaproteobacteria bacterium]